MKKRIFMIGYSTDKGGVETYIKNICSELQNDFEIILNWPVMEIDGKEWRIPANRHNPLKYFPFWKKFFEENHFDAVYYNTCDIVSIDPLVFAKKAGVPVRIIHSHCTGNQVERGGIIGAIHRWQEKHSRKTLGRFATHLLACSRSAGDWMFDKRPYQIIQNGIDLERYSYSQQKYNAIARDIGIANGPVVAALGRLDTVKNPFFSLEIFQHLCKKDARARCFFIGDGEHYEELKKMVRDSGLDKQIIFTGGVDNVNEWLSYINCLLMPSIFEGLPFALIEAQAAGIRSLVSDSVSDEANITGLVEYKSLLVSPEEWAERLLELSRMPRLDVSNKLIAAGFSIKHTAEAIRSTLNEME